MNEYDKKANEVYSDFKEREERVNRNIDDVLEKLAMLNEVFSKEMEPNEDGVIVLEPQLIKPGEQRNFTTVETIEKLEKQREARFKHLSDYWQTTKTRLEIIALKKTLNLPL